MPADLRFDARLFMETLDCADEDHVALLVRDKDNPVRLDDGDTTAVLMPLCRDTTPRTGEVSPAERGAESLEAALTLPDPDAKEFFGRPAKPRKAVAGVSLAEVMAWVADAPKHEREQAHTLLGQYMLTQETHATEAPAMAETVSAVA